jgi:hypothetical protein
MHIFNFQIIQSRHRLRYGLEDWGSFPGRGNDGIFPFATASSLALGLNQPPIRWVPGKKQPGREVGYSPLSNAEVKNAWNYTCIPQYVFTAVDMSPLCVS